MDLVSSQSMSSVHEFMYNLQSLDSKGKKHWLEWQRWRRRQSPRRVHVRPTARLPLRRLAHSGHGAPAWLETLDTADGSAQYSLVPARECHVTLSSLHAATSLPAPVLVLAAPPGPAAGGAPASVMRTSASTVPPMLLWNDHVASHPSQLGTAVMSCGKA